MMGTTPGSRGERSLVAVEEGIEVVELGEAVSFVDRADHLAGGVVGDHADDVCVRMSEELAPELAGLG